MNKRRVSIRDVANASGVSLTTVSLVLNKNDARISEPTRQRVLQAMDKLGYTPSRLARGLPTRRANTIAILVPALQNAFADAYFGEIISGIYETAAERGYRVLLEVARREFIRRKSYEVLLEDCSVDGILFIGSTEEHRFLAEFDGTGKPLMVVNNWFEQWTLNHVVCDYEQAGLLAADHLADLGHTRIGHISGPSNVVRTSRALTDSFLNRLNDRGIRLPSDMIADGEFLVETGMLAARELLRRDPDLTAIFAGNDKMAIGAMRALRDAGRVPGQDVAVLGCDDIAQAALVDPPLSTIRLNFTEVGSRACDRLLDLVEGRIEIREDGRAVPIAERMPVHLIDRDSCRRAIGTSVS
ncbi:MAG: LacI family DNA-binding transcriptional regulator [Phycisphaerales bacterium]